MSFIMSKYFTYFFGMSCGFFFFAISILFTSQIRWLEHVRRIEQTVSAIKTFDDETYQKRSRGRTKPRWQHQVIDDWCRKLEKRRSILQQLERFDDADKDAQCTLEPTKKKKIFFLRRSACIISRRQDSNIFIFALIY